MKEDCMEDSCGVEELARGPERKVEGMRAFHHVFDACWVREDFEDVFGRPSLLHHERRFTRLCASRRCHALQAAILALRSQISYGKRKEY